MLRYMSSRLLRVASEHSSVVAVVGKGHLPGIKKYWKQPVEVCSFSVLMCQIILALPNICSPGPYTRLMLDGKTC